MESAEKPLVIRIRQSAMDDADFPLGIVRLTTDERVAYMNRAAKLMVGEETRVGDTLDSIPFDADSQANLRLALRERFEAERGTSYKLQLPRVSATQVKVRVSALPEYDSDGLLAGSIGIVVDESIALATINIHRAIQESDGACALYDALTAQLHEVIAFDSLMVTGISRKRGHLQRLYENPAPPEDVLPTKWFPMRPFVKAMFDHFEQGSMDLDALFMKPEFVEYERSDPAVRQFRKRGFRYSLRLGIGQAGRLVAAVSLMRTAAVPFTDEELRRCKQLPIVEVVNAAMALEKQRHMAFGLDLINDIADSAGSMLAVAQRLVERLADHYGWEHVSLFRVDDDRKRARLISQAGRARLHPQFEQPFSQGLIGKACTDRAAVNVGDVNTKSMAGVYVRGIEGMRSELVLPLMGLDLRWLVNIESSQRDAFADEEQSSVEVLLRVAGFVLDCTAALELKTAILDAVADGIIQTDELGVIQHANPAAQRLLGRTLEQLKHRSIAGFIASESEEHGVDDDEQAELGGWETAPTGVAKSNPGALLVQSESVRAQPVLLLAADDKPVRALLSSATLPNDLGGKVFVATDISQQDRVERLRQLSRALSQISSEIRVPLGLASTFLTDGLRNSTHDVIDKALQQIRKASLPLERIVRLDAAIDDGPLPRTVIDLRGLVKRIRKQLPKGDQNDVNLDPRDEAPVLASAAPHELAFCIESVLSHLLRSKSQVEQVNIRVGKSARRSFVLLTTSPNSNQPETDSGEVGVAGPGPQLAEKPVISGLMERMSGAFSMRDGPTPLFRVVMRSGEQSDEVAATDRP